MEQIKSVLVFAEKKIVLEILHDNALHTYSMSPVKAASKIYARERKHCFPWVRSLLPPL